MKRLTEGAHQTSIDLTAVNAAYASYTSSKKMFTEVCRAKHDQYLLGVVDKV